MYTLRRSFLYAEWHSIKTGYEMEQVWFTLERWHFTRASTVTTWNEFLRLVRFLVFSWVTQTEVTVIICRYLLFCSHGLWVAWTTCNKHFMCQSIIYYNFILLYWVSCTFVWTYIRMFNLFLIITDNKWINRIMNINTTDLY